MSKRSAREAAMRRLYSYDITGETEILQSDEESLDQPHLIEVGSLTANDRDFISRVDALFPLHAEEIDAVISDNTKRWRFDRISKVDLAILRLAILEIQYLDSPPKVVINEAVELAKKYSSEKAYKFINGLLGGYINR